MCGEFVFEKSGENFAKEYKWLKVLKTDNNVCRTIKNMMIFLINIPYCKPKIHTSRRIFWCINKEPQKYGN
jgi:hypothetical protein